MFHKKPPTTQTSDDNLAEMRTHWDQQPLNFQQEPTAVAQGPSPLAFIFIAGGPVRVVDLTANIQVASTVVESQTLVRVDDRNGVIAGKETIAPGPLPAGHQYAIYADPTTTNVIRHGVGPPAPLPPPFTSAGSPSRQP